LTQTPAFVAPARRLTHAGACAMMTAAIAAANRMEISVSVAIVDAGGHLLAFQRTDGSRFHTVYSATTKAATAASNRRPTTSRGAQGQDLDVAHALGLALAAGPSRWTAMEGGFPILVSGECLGGIGVSGGDWEQDQAIAQAAIAIVEAASP
jgi:glc operon protein GlcG